MVAANETFSLVVSYTGALNETTLKGARSEKEEEIEPANGQRSTKKKKRERECSFEIGRWSSKR